MSSPQAAITERLWRAGRISELLLDANQQEFNKLAREHPSRRVVLASARRSGKSHGLCGLAIEVCLQQPGAQVCIVTKTADQIRTIIIPLLEKLVATCPADIRPIFRPTYGEIRFPNGSKIILAGVESAAFNRLRGLELHLAVVDEAGFIATSDLDETVKAVLSPTLLTTGGPMVIASTPPPSTDHNFIRLYDEAAAEGASRRWTVYDNPRMTPEIIARAVRDCGGADTPRFKREFLAEFISDLTRSVIPEWSTGRLVENRSTYGCADHYVALDLGERDPTAILWCTWIPETRQLYVSNEFLERGATLSRIATAEKQGTALVWPAGANITRVADSPPLVLNELSLSYGLHVDPVDKIGKEAQISALRSAIASGQVVLSPAVPLLDETLKAAVWNDDRTSYIRSAKLGHMDLLDALVYAWRVVRQDVPTEPLVQLDPLRMKMRETYYPQEELDGAAGSFLEAFGQNRGSARGTTQAMRGLWRK